MAISYGLATVRFSYSLTAAAPARVGRRSSSNCSGRDRGAFSLAFPSRLGRRGRFGLGRDDGKHASARDKQANFVTRHVSRESSAERGDKGGRRDVLVDWIHLKWSYVKCGARPGNSSNRSARHKFLAMVERSGAIAGYL
jgi:hypothetical protein